TSKYYNYPSSSVYSSHPEYGLLYTWSAASGRTNHTDGEVNNAGQEQYPGICPAGWHLPSDYEWNQLEEEIAKSDAGVYSTTAATTWETSYSTDTGYRGAHGQKMKSTTAVTTNPAGTSNSSTTNGFNALFVGRVHDGSVSSYGLIAYFWSSSSNSSSDAWFRNLRYDNTGVYRSNGYYKYNMFSVRCKKD
ncbi:MAG: fibrobacter succinogenes major paralogous domain-containing protein, partial [Dysgonamonadaceae bacterium]|nr:fibrobacter succinogenes major paralogous domain-containing protein [Dysgonamonadaceae bacterium]